MKAFVITCHRCEASVTARYRITVDTNDQRHAELDPPDINAGWTERLDHDGRTLVDVCPGCADEIDELLREIEREAGA